MRFYRGVVRSYDSTNHKADVLLVGSMSRLALGVPVAQHIGPELLVPGAHCGLLFFSGGSEGVVVCTFGEPPPTPVYIYQDTGSSLTLTTTWQNIPNLSITVTPTTGKTWKTVVLGRLLLRNMGTADPCDLQACIARNGTLVGSVGVAVVYDAWEGSSVPLYWAEDVASTSPRTYTIMARKAGGSYEKLGDSPHMLVMAIPK
jgi:hypothetical protein